MLIRATQADLPAINALLSAHIDTSMFPLDNLSRHGLDGTAKRSMRIWRDAEMQNVLCITNEGMVMPQMPSATQAHLQAAAQVLSGEDCIGFIGPGGQVRALLLACGLVDVPCLVNADEPRFSLSLDDLKVPQIPNAELLPFSPEHRNTICDWGQAYLIEALSETPDKAREKAPLDFEARLKRDSHRILIIDRQPVAMSGYNAWVQDVAQIGGVYTPPALRGKGYAGLAVALHLQELQARGVTRSVLFAASQYAARAYEKIGFELTGDFALVLFKEPQRMP